jgi:RNA polymerase sigma-70 factor (ECF subfamily)
VESALDGDRRSRFEHVAAQVYEPVQRYLRRRTDAATADDVLGDVLLVAWRRLDDVPTEAPLAWMYGVARRCLANSVRSAERQDRLVRRLADAPVQEYDGDGRLEDALAAVSDAEREILQLWAWEQLPPREIAQALGITANAASIRLHRAIKRLRQVMTDGKDTRPPGHLQQRQDKEAPR